MLTPHAHSSYGTSKAWFGATAHARNGATCRGPNAACASSGAARYDYIPGARFARRNAVPFSIRLKSSTAESSTGPDDPPRGIDRIWKMAQK